MSLAWPSLDDVIADSQSETVSDALISLQLARHSHHRDTQAGLLFIHSIDTQVALTLTWSQLARQSRHRDTQVGFLFIHRIDTQCVRDMLALICDTQVSFSSVTVISSVSVALVFLVTLTSCI